MGWMQANSFRLNMTFNDFIHCISSSLPCWFADVMYCMYVLHVCMYVCMYVCIACMYVCMHGLDATNNFWLSMAFHGFLESLRKLPDALPLLPISSRPTIFLAKSPYPGGPLLCTDPFTRFGPQIWYRNHSPVSGTHDALGALRAITPGTCHTLLVLGLSWPHRGHERMTNLL